MDCENNIKPLRINISMPEKFHERMQNYATKKDVALSSLIRSALKVYTNDDEDCFVGLTKEHSGSEAADHAAKAINKHNINQSHLLGHVLKEAAISLSRLEDGQDWHEIRFATNKSKEKDDFSEMLDRFEAILKRRDELQDKSA